ncbi:MAG TPA: hypothetical protein VJ110_03560 [Candidatus Nanoarchaeia archaeon]|nr:hypothetical protein [Candidatus Nanoarchaeia archaeon]
MMTINIGEKISLKSVAAQKLQGTMMRAPSEIKDFAEPAELCSAWSTVKGVA